MDRLIIGGGISDVQNAPMGRHGHWDKHGQWKADKTYTYISDDGKVTRTWRRKEGPTAVAVRREEVVVEMKMGDDLSSV